jgi:hypothetical protein
MKHCSPTDQETMLLALRQDLEAARKRVEIASAHFDAVVRNVPSRKTYPDSVHRMQKASSDYAEAQKAALAALMRLNEFLIYGTVPPGLEKEQEPEPRMRRQPLTNSSAMDKVTIQARPIKEGDWRVVATGTWTPGEQPQLGDEILPVEVITALFNITPSPTDKSCRNEIKCGDMLYAVVFRRLSR